MPRFPISSRTLTALLSVALLGAGSRLEAQGRAPSGFDSFIMVVAPRDTVTIKKQIRSAADAVAAAEKARQVAETMRLGASSRIEFKKVEITRIKERINLARKENREADRVGLEAERKAAEREIELLKRREELRDAESVLETKRADLAGLTKQALELELQLASRRAQRRRSPVGGAGGASLDRVIGELEKQTLEAQRAQAAASIDLSDQEIRVLDRRLDMLDAQQRVLAGT
jgi:chromosome segregation ATPase